MKKTYFVFIFLLFSFSKILAQTEYFAVASGNWNDANTWASTPGGAAGFGTPSAGDIVYTEGFNVRVNSSYTIGMVLVAYNVANGLDKTGIGTKTLTITGQLASYDPTLFDYAAPTTTIVENTSQLNIVLTGEDLATLGFGSSDPVLFSWSHSATFSKIAFNPPSSATTLHTEGLSLNAGILTVQNGTLQLDAGNEIRDVTASSTLQINDGASLDIRGALNGGDATSNFSNVLMVGASTVTVNANGYLNSDAFTISAGALLNITNNQPAGWWHSSSPGPTSVPIDATSTIDYNRLGDQSVYPGTYGNLSLSGSGIKTLTNQNTLYVNGDLSIIGSGVTFSTASNTSPIDISGNLHNDGTWSPSQRINFTGLSAQSITGNNVITFGGGVTISNSSGVSLSNQDADINGTLDIDPSAVFNPNSQQVNLSGNLVNDGSITASGTFIFDGTTIVSGSGANAFENVTISGSLSAPSITATIAGNFANNGTFSNVNGTVTFNGINAQSISGSSTIDFYNLGVTNSTQIVSNNATLNLMTSLTMGAGSTLDADGAGSGVFTVTSSSGSNAARINAIPSDASVTGNITVQRFFDGGGDVWRNFGTSVSGATVSQITTAGLTINGNDLAYYNESVTGGVDNGWVLQSTFGSSISNSRGYSMWTRTEEMPVTINFTGTLNQQSQSIPLTYTASAGATDDGWNLVNNPFPSTVDWDLMTRNGSVSGIVAVWNTVSDNYDYWNGSTGNLANGLIASGQAFWVQTNAAGPTLSIPESAKTTSGTSFLKISEDPASNVLILSLSKDGITDETFVQFRGDATEGFDNQFDGLKLRNNIFNLATLDTEGQSLAINSLPFVDCGATVKVDFYDMLWDNNLKAYYRGMAEGDYSISFGNLSSFDMSYEFSLIDNYANKTVSINDGFQYNFTVTGDPGSWGNSRFEIELSQSTINETIEYLEVNPCDLSNDLVITNAQLGASYTLLKDGAEITSVIAEDTNVVVPLTDQYVNEGLNQFDLKINMGTCSSVTVPGAISISKYSLQEVGVIEDGKNCGPGRVLISASGAQGNAYYKWYESLDSSLPIEGQNGDQYLTPELETSKYYYVSIANEEGCESLERVKVLAEIVNLPKPDIIIEGDVLSTTLVADSYQWYKDGEAISGETGQSVNVYESGAYALQIELNGCSNTSENAVVEVLGLEDLKLSGISVYPNPVESALYVDSDRMDIEQIMLYNINGMLIYKSDEDFNGEIDMTTIKKGIYILNIVTENQIINYRIQKK